MNELERSIGLFLMSLFFTLGAYAINAEILNNHLSIGEFILVFMSILLAFCLMYIFEKSGRNGFYALIPIYNIIILLKITEKPVWWFVLFLIPIVNLVIAIWVTNILSKKFSKSEGFTIGLVLLPFLFYPVLALDDSEYKND